LIIILLGGDPTQFLQQQTQQQPTQTEYDQALGQARPDDELAEFVSVVLKETEDVWEILFREQLGRNYQQPTLVIFDGQVSSACGMASSATGPFYCPGDQKLYIDLSFYRELSQKFGAPGDFAMAYVVAHEVAHHVQNLLGYTRQMQQQRGRISETAYNQLSVRLELQADFLSGVWAYHMKNKGLLDEGDIEEALRCANAIGDDRIQKQARGYVVPDSFTHGTSEQRKRWFKLGFDTGDLSQGDTFGAKTL
jgi:predicted metalloprotease